MNTDNIKRSFQKMGADFETKTVAKLHRDRAAYTIDVQKGVFILSLREIDLEDLSVVDLDIKDRHALLNVTIREKDGSLTKDKWLCGHDERDWFVGAIAGQPANIVKAKDSLKPVAVREAEVNVPKKSRQKRKNKARVRQGEWFFIPAPGLEVSEWLIHKNEPITRGDGGKPHMIDEVYRDGGVTVYVSKRYPNGLTQAEYGALPANTRGSQKFRLMKRDAAVYARGHVRHKDHATIYLEGWHRVVMNTEGESRAKSNLAFLD